MRVRIALLSAVAVVAVTPAAYSSATSSRVARPATDSGFAGPIAARPRAIDVDLSSSTSALRPIRCASSLPGTRCWVTLSLK